MTDMLDFPLDSNAIIRKRKLIKKELLLTRPVQKIRVAVLGGSTTSEIVNIMELFLIKRGFSPDFYESEYNKYFEDAVFTNARLAAFKPDIIYIHTTQKNIHNYPSYDSNAEQVDQLLQSEVAKFQSIWESLQKYNCPIIQNNFDFQLSRSLGNLDSYDIHGKTYFLTRLNLEFARQAQENKSLYINDINHLSAVIGLETWFDQKLWHIAKYALSFDAIPHLANNLANIIGAIFGKSKKCLVVDLDNTCWGGVIGDDGINGISLGNETASGEAFMDFQKYVKELSERGIILAVCSKNDYETAKEGFTHSDSVLKFSDFASFKANWEPKSENIKDIVKEINIGFDAIVFIDDNAAERNIVSSNIPGVIVPDVGDNILDFKHHIDRNGFFEAISFSIDDLNRNIYYTDNNNRVAQQSQFENYYDFLVSLKMKAEIQSFSSQYIERITQLINKTNQFNLTTKRYTTAEVEFFSNSSKHITLYGKLSDKFGDNGLVSVIIGEIKEMIYHIDLWIMSCRVLKREMEYVMLEMLVTECWNKNVTEIIGYYERTSKNDMVSRFYEQLGFEEVSHEDKGRSEWRLLLKDFVKKDVPISIIKPKMAVKNF